MLAPVSSHTPHAAPRRPTAAAVRCEDLRPDVDWAYLRGTVQPTHQPA